MMLAGGGADLPLAAAAARIAATEAYDFASKENIQTHGGIGFTWEADTQFHLRRARLMALNIGGPRTREEKRGPPLAQKHTGRGEGSTLTVHRPPGKSPIPPEMPASTA